MFKKLTFIMVLALTICSFAFFSQNSDKPVTQYRVTELHDAFTGFNPVNTLANSHPRFVNIPMIFEGAKSQGDAEIGPEIPISGLTGFYDYHFNGNQDHYIYRFSSTIMHARFI